MTEVVSEPTSLPVAQDALRRVGGDLDFTPRAGIAQTWVSDDAVRVSLLNLTGADSLYALDRMDRVPGAPAPEAVASHDTHEDPAFLGDWSI